ncbi:hypothetical protein J1N35_002125 [Gossypium stocksii]|uniref:RNase H type-1 domain-containing protein n=1 Tax=Gossypium stocksii TaxID=47602 RepID=A0A9D3WKE8_9ROSI|nr:hypothetical protein J1N35_002125 [Gossypium stocksii]
MVLMQAVRGQVDKAQSICEKANNLCNNFRIYNLVNPPIIAQNRDTKKWEKPLKGFIKINFDASVNDNRIGYGIILRDEDGFVLGGGGGFSEGNISVLEAKCIALEKSIEVVGKLNIQGDVIFETDNAGLVNKLNKGEEDITIIGSRIRKCKEAFSLFKSANLVWSHRSCNSMADLICTKMCSEGKTWFFEMDYPKEIHNVIIKDIT